MSKRFCLSVFLIIGIAGSSVMAQSMVPIDPATVTNGHVYLMENVGANLPDDSANSNNGNLLGSPQVVPGLNGDALQFNGTNQGVHLPDAATINTGVHQNKTVIAVFNCADVSKSAKQVVFEEGGSTRGMCIYVHQGLAYAGGWNIADYTPQWSPGTWLSAPIGSNEWHVVAAVLRDGGAGQADDKFEMWMDGVLIAKGPGGELRARSDDNGVGTVQAQTRVHGGEVLNAGNWFEGIVDEIWILNQALSEAELAAIGFSRTTAANPVPVDGATDIPRDAMLAWEANEFAATHDVYFGTAFADVNDAGRGNAMGVLASQGQAGVQYDPDGLLEYGQTYFWRIDEVNGAPDNTIFKGEVWSFTVEPYGYPVQPVAATASSVTPGMGPENTLNGVGLDADDQHSTTETTMWLSDGTGANWIQYEFDQAYKLHELLVWNSNQMIEAFLGFGAKDVTVEYSTDGETWTALEGVPQFAQASGMPTYTANTTVAFNGALAQFVRLTVNSNWGGVTPQSGLSEVRFSYVPVQAREPMPADGATEVSLDADLDWRPGREATSHEVFFGTDASALTLVDTAADHGYTPAGMNFGTTYYWKVNEVGDTGTYEGDVWSFASQEYAPIDDFESYTDDIDAEATIWHAWIDGLTTGASGSQVGYDVAPFAEKSTVHGGKQSMPMKYDNSGAPFVSEAEREFASTQNWTVNGADTLSLWVQGVPAAYIEEGGTITMSGAGHDIWDAADDFRFAYKTLTGDGSIVVKVESIVNTNAWAKAGVMIRESLDADSKFVYMIQSFAQGVSMGNRPTTAATCASTTVAGVAFPQWVKLIRKGDVFTAQYSADGAIWTDVKDAAGAAVSTTVAMTNPVYIGLCVTSHNAAATTTAVMSGAAATGNVTGGSWEVLAIGDDPQPANAPGDLYVTVQDSAGKTATATNATAATTGAWTEWQIPLSSFTGVNMTRVEKLTIGVDSRNSATKGAGIIYVDDIGYGHPIITP